MELSRSKVHKVGNHHSKIDTLAANILVSVDFEEHNIFLCLDRNCCHAQVTVKLATSAHTISAETVSIIVRRVDYYFNLTSRHHSKMSGYS